MGYKCKHLIVTTLFNQKDEFSAIDISKFETKSIIHFIVGAPMSPPLWMPKNQSMISDYWGKGYVFLDEDGMWCFE